MYNKFKNLVINDLKTISLNHGILILLLILILIVILLPVCFSPVSHSVYLATGLQPSKYYTLISVTLVSLIPVLTGIAYGKLISDKTAVTTIKDSLKVTGAVPDSTFIRIFSSLVICFILIFFSILLIKPVPSQGWLRTLYAALLLSVQTPFILLLVAGTGTKKIAGTGLLIFYLLFQIALPLGLVVHHPWNYLAFFSPFYWIAWAWMIGPPVESIICGSIAMILSLVVLFALLKYYLPRHNS